MRARTIEGGFDVMRPELDDATRARLQAAARRVIAEMALPDGDDLCDMLGLNEPNEPAEPSVRPTAPAADPSGTPRVVATIRSATATENWLHKAACRDEDPELHFPVGTSGPALLQIEKAKAVCRRCPVIDECRQWALDSGQDAGVWGGMSEEERRALKRPTHQAVAA